MQSLKSFYHSIIQSMLSIVMQIHWVFIKSSCVSCCVWLEADAKIIDDSLLDQFIE